MPKPRRQFDKGTPQTLSAALDDGLYLAGLKVSAEERALIEAAIKDFLRQHLGVLMLSPLADTDLPIIKRFAERVLGDKADDNA